MPFNASPLASGFMQGFGFMQSLDDHRREQARQDQYDRQRQAQFGLNQQLKQARLAHYNRQQQQTQADRAKQEKQQAIQNYATAIMYAKKNDLPLKKQWVEGLQKAIGTIPAYLTSDQAGRDFQTADSVMQGKTPLNSPPAHAAASRLLQGHLNKNLGEIGRNGGLITAKTIAGIFPSPDGQGVMMDLKNHTPKGPYTAAMTEGRSVDGDTVHQTDGRQLAGHIAGLKGLRAWFLAHGVKFPEQKAAKPVTVKPGETVFNPQTGKAMFTAPANQAPKAPKLYKVGNNLVNSAGHVVYRGPAASGPKMGSYSPQRAFSQIDGAIGSQFGLELDPGSGQYIDTPRSTMAKAAAAQYERKHPMQLAPDELAAKVKTLMKGFELTAAAKAQAQKQAVADADAYAKAHSPTGLLSLFEGPDWGTYKTRKNFIQQKSDANLAALAAKAHAKTRARLQAFINQGAKQRVSGKKLASLGATRKARSRRSSSFIAGNTTPKGMVTPGNIDITKRPIHYNPDGSYSTVRSISIGTDKGEVLIPTIAPNGQRLTNKQAIALYRKTGQNLGTFKDVPTANAYAEHLHRQQARMYDQRATQNKPKRSIGANIAEQAHQAVQQGANKRAVAERLAKMGYNQKTIRQWLQ